ncbi:KTSC domain-containing protein [Halalkalicoccus salilacus]
MKAITTDGRELECETVEERDHGVALYDADRQQIGYVPYERFKYAIRLRTPVASTSIRSVGYDDEADRLEIEFHSGTSTSTSPSGSTPTCSAPTRAAGTSTTRSAVSTRSDSSADRPGAAVISVLLS